MTAAQAIVIMIALSSPEEQEVVMTGSEAEDFMKQVMERENGLPS